MQQKNKTSQINIKDPNLDLAKLDRVVDKLIKRYPDGAPDHIIAQNLGITEKELEARYQEIISCLQDEMSV